MFQFAHRFFFALLPPVVRARQIANAAHWFETVGTPVRADRLHITLLILRDQIERSEELIAKLREIGSRIQAAPIEIVLDYVSGGTRSIALRPQHKNSRLAALHNQLAEYCADFQLAEMPGHDFSPHVTLGYRDGRPFGERIAPVGWIADELVLIHSHLGKTRHDILGRWSLIPADDPQLSLF